MSTLSSSAEEQSSSDYMNIDTASSQRSGMPGKGRSDALSPGVQRPQNHLEPLPRVLRTAMKYAEADRNGRECPWYGVWTVVLRDCMFSTVSDEGCFVFNTIPQYSLVADVDTVLDTGFSVPDDPMESPEPSHKSMRLTRIPDFVQLLHKLAYEEDNFNIVGTRTLFIFEVKPHSDPRNFGDLWANQVELQTALAFQQDISLQSLGVMMAMGVYWTFRLVARPSQLVLDSMSAKPIRDSTFQPDDDNGDDDSDNDIDNDNDNDSDGEYQGPHFKLPGLPAFLKPFSGGRPFFALGNDDDHSMSAFRAIVNNLRPRVTSNS